MNETPSDTELTDAEVDAILAEPVPFDAARDLRIAELFKQKWIAATAEANHKTPQCNHDSGVRCSRCCDCPECHEIRLSDAAAAFDVELPHWLARVDGPQATKESK
jgi:hypothetical protein